MPDSSFQKIKSFLRLNAASVLQLDLNEASREDLQSHPYIRWQLAKAIIDYRLENGPFATVDDLLKIPGIGPTTLDKLRGLITTGN